MSLSTRQSDTLATNSFNGLIFEQTTATLFSIASKTTKPKPSDSDKYKNIREENFFQWKNIMKEDLDIIEGMQEGRYSPAYNGGNFSPVLDNPTHHFAKWVVNTLIN